jgi:hypothetical protein
VEQDLVIITNAVGPLNFLSELMRRFILGGPIKQHCVDLISGGHEARYGVGLWHTPHTCAPIDKSITSSFPQKRLDHDVQFWQGKLCLYPACQWISPESWAVLCSLFICTGLIRSKLIGWLVSACFDWFNYIKVDWLIGVNLFWLV